MNYFVSYNYSIPNGVHGAGVCSITRPAPIMDIDDISKIANDIREQTNQPENCNVVIINWRRFEEAEE